MPSKPKQGYANRAAQVQLRRSSTNTGVDGNDEGSTTWPAAARKTLRALFLNNQFDSARDFERADRNEVPVHGHQRRQLRAVEGMVVAVGASLLLWYSIFAIARQVALVYCS